jgi:cation diffusion facilitator CzcD-associated flavoprotein CzcO
VTSAIATPRKAAASRSRKAATLVDVLIIGAGPSGLSACIKLQEQGITDTVILDRAPRIGGTWALNDYPGLRCDVPSELYSLGYAPKPDWSRTYAPQAEIRDYLEGVARQFGIVDRIRLDTEVTEARWDGKAERWAVSTAAGEKWSARLLVAAPGYIGEAQMPHFPGQEKFRGTIFHSGQWNHAHDLSGERVAVIGCGASAIQFLPAIQPVAKQIVSLQRTPSWVLPKPDFAMPKAASALFRRAPALQKLVREAGLMGLEPSLPVFMNEKLLRRLTHPLGLWNIHRSIKDPEMRRQLTPQHTLGCKRPLFSNDWYEALAQPNVQVVFQGLERITENGIVTEDGTEIAVDTIIFGTGYAVAEPAIYRILKGADGRTLSEHWQGRPRAYQGVAIHGFPNMFMMLGPNSHSVQGSVMWTSEQQAVYIAQAAKTVFGTGIRRFEVQRAVQDDFNAHIDRRLARMPIRGDVCSSYYLDSSGRNQFVWPEFGVNIKRRLHHFDLADYSVQ